MIKRFILISIIILNFQGIGICQIDQNVDKLKTVIPPSPTASALGKYADWPVNLYTGLPQINIPIYEVKGSSISVPISLSYHASGIKVGENASNVGLGWSLQAGGVITRSVRGLADDAPGYGYLAIRGYYNNPGDMSLGTVQNGTSAFSDSSLQVSAASGNADSEPDLYMFSAMGSSYKFYFAGDGTIVTQPYSNLKIKFNNSMSSSSWTVTMENGTKLLFGGGSNFVETTNTYQTNVVSDPYISSWYLQSITSVTGEVVNFTYVSTGEVMLDRHLYQSDYLLNYIAINTVQPSTIKVAKNINRTMGINFLTPATIESDLCRVYFDTIPRLDLPGSVAISGIRVFSKLQNKFIQSYSLNYVYSNTASGNTYTSAYSPPLLRLKLDNLKELLSDNSTHKVWQFSYNPLSLPSRKSFAQDHWGYYNGATNNTTLKPFIINFNPDNYTFGNRSPDSASMMAEMLTKITYPTGGSSTFVYEPNSYPANEEGFNKTPVYQSLSLTFGQSNFNNTSSATIIITRAQYFKFQFTGVFSSTYLQDYGTNTTLASAVLKNSAGTTITSTSLKNADNGVTYTSPSVLLVPGTYTFTISSISTQGDFSSTLETVSLSSSFNYLQSTGINAVNHMVGGVRVKSISDYDGIDATRNVNRYYTYENANVISPVDSTSDYLSSTTDNTYQCEVSLELGLFPDITGSVVYYVRDASTKFSLGSIQGGTIGYGKVTEKFGPNGENGKKVYYYTNGSDINVSSAKAFPFPAIVSLDYERGLLLESDTYTAGNALVSRLLNSYQFDSRGTIKAYKAAYKFNSLSSCFLFNYLSDYITRSFYTDQTNQVKSVTSTQVAYNLLTGDSLRTVTTNYYDNVNNLSPTRVETTDSKGLLLKALNYTPLDKTSINTLTPLTTGASLAIDSMVARNIISPVIQQVQYRNSSLTQLTLTNYKLWGNNIISPENVQVKVASNPVETRVQFNKYDIKGNLLEQQKALDVKKNYLYDYKGTYPIAEVSNADSASIAYSSFEADALGNWVNTDTARNRQYALTGSQCYNLVTGKSFAKSVAAGTTYIVSYWSRSGAVTVTANGVGTTATAGLTKNGWTYYEHSLPTTTTSVSVTATNALIDELRLYPSAAQMSTYTYVPLVGLSSVCSPNNTIAYYEYDAFNRLLAIRDMDKNILKQFDYQYQTYPHTNPVWQTITGPYCEVINTYNTGNQITVQKDVNSQSPTYGNTQTLTVNNTAACPLPVTVTITCANYAAIAGYTAKYTNAGTGSVYTFNIGAGTATQTLGTVPQGTYTLTFTNTGGTVTYVFDSGCSTKSGTTPVTFSNLAVSSTGCKNISIDTVN